ncbi:hypothetical protein [Larkinella soli]|uniref:hypothetical protein n=1 Tax=Larkinella soli TaxID=1770527 RepID=UPI000FFCB74B|nr:hypothetical protein [Larkinella soli]
MRRKLYLLILLFGVFMTAALAQGQQAKGRFHVRFLVKSVDCSAGRAVILVQVKSSTADSTFLMGDANYRFDYDTRLIQDPVLLEQTNFSSIAPASDNRYQPQNLNGSTAGPTVGTVSLNTLYNNSGVAPKLVPTEWTTVSCIGFTIIDTERIQNNCFPLIWHTDQIFRKPATLVRIRFASRSAIRRTCVRPSKCRSWWSICRIRPRWLPCRSSRTARRPPRPVCRSSTRMPTTRIP